MKMYYVINARLPNKKAYGIQVAKMCEAFIEAGVDVTLIIPRTRASRSSSMRDFYGLRIDVPTKMLPTIDWYDGGRLGYYLSATIFAISCAAYLMIQRMYRKQGIFYSIPDTFSLVAGLLAGMDCYLEIHEMLLQWPLLRLLHRARGLIATNALIARSLVAVIPGYEDITIEPNGVDLAYFSVAPTKETARQQLGLSQSEKIALYVGRFYQWKGLSILTAAAQRAPHIAWYVVGGTHDEFIQATGQRVIPSNLHVIGECPSNEVPRWLATADVLLILGTKENERSFRNTTPMKIYEYMAARRPVVASRTPSLASIIHESEVAFYEPDDASNLATAVEGIIANPTGTVAMVERAYQSAQEHTWAQRASRILARV